jgi:hypothetical protein
LDKGIMGAVAILKNGSTGRLLGGDGQHVRGCLFKVIGGSGLREEGEPLGEEGDGVCVSCAASSREKALKTPVVLGSGAYVPPFTMVCPARAFVRFQV